MSKQVEVVRRKQPNPTEKKIVFYWNLSRILLTFGVAIAYLISH